ncbi:hypothetical protein QFC20_001628 [Naganishia adeliensis]|uniref:Uncharacterized protein n=1 Tax=Naganishia adeliensis TaxID=92952 RepID=A0ACC2WR65_9TREE|nr:hypothetical protein QFC20_001628 [Naganishia adeliensis]
MPSERTAISLTRQPRLTSGSSRESTTRRHPIFGSAGSRLLDGTTPQHSALEDRLSSFFSYDSIPGSSSSSASTTRDSALLFNSGFDANVSFFSTVPQKTDYIIYDELVHASVWDGMRANERRGVPVSRRRAFRHGNVAHLERILEDIVSAEQKASQATATTRQVGMIFIAMESLYSMDGDLAPLPQIIAALKKLQMRYPSLVNPARVCVVIDEAHTTGVYGSQGKGFVYDMVEREKAGRGGQSRIAEWVQVRLMTFGKGMGSQGGKLGLCFSSARRTPSSFVPPATSITIQPPISRPNTNMPAPYAPSPRTRAPSSSKGIPGEAGGASNCTTRAREDQNMFAFGQFGG